MNDTNDTTNSSHPTPGAGDPRAVFAQAVLTARTTIEGVRSDQMELATPCDGYDVRRMLGHLVMVVQRVACAGRDEDFMAWPDEVTGLDDDAWVDAFNDGAHDVQAAWADAAILARDTVLPWTTMSGAETLAMYANELTVHTWDVASVTGQSPDWNDEVLVRSWEAVQRELPDADRGPLWDAFKAQMPEGIPFDPPFANAVDVPAVAPMIDRLVAWNGRRP